MYWLTIFLIGATLVFLFPLIGRMDFSKSLIAGLIALLLGFGVNWVAVHYGLYRFENTLFPILGVSSFHTEQLSL